MLRRSCIDAQLFQSWAPLLFFASLFIISSTAAAQRGGSYGENAKPWESTSQGFPGYFDTNVARKGSLVVEFPPMIFGILPTPFVAVDYGVTDTLTIGTNGVVSALPWLLNGEGASIKIRSLLLGDETEQSAVTYYGGIIRIHGKTQINSYYHVMTWNHAWRIGSRHTIGARANYIRLNVELGEETDLNHADLGFSSFMTGAGYGFEINPRWALRADAIASLYQSIEADTVAISFNQSSSLRKPKSTTLIGVGQVEYHPFEDWLFGLGVTGFNVGGAGAAAPWFTWATRW